ncbi:MAG: response regulator [Gemmataceae bacterium]
MMTPLRILLVEDNPVNQMVAQRMLEKAGHRVVVAENGRQALNRLSVEPVDLVLMDLQMPEMDGLEATRTIRSQEAGTNRRLPILAVTADAVGGDRERCLAAGMDAYLTKPVQSTALLKAIHDVLGTARGMI